MREDIAKKLVEPIEEKKGDDFDTDTISSDSEDGNQWQNQDQDKTNIASKEDPK